jgi:hypothetical protein
MRTSRKISALAAPLAVLSILGVGCGGSGLSASSSCKDFMAASASEQHEVIDQLSSHYDKPDYATPIGEPEVPYYCTASPSVTLGQFFQKAED